MSFPIARKPLFAVTIELNGTCNENIVADRMYINIDTYHLNEILGRLSPFLNKSEHERSSNRVKHAAILYAPVAHNEWSSAVIE